MMKVPSKITRRTITKSMKVEEKSNSESTYF